MHTTTCGLSPATTKPQRGPGSFWHPAPWQHPWVGASERFWSRKTKSQGGSKPTSNSEPPGFAPSTALVLCNQQCHLGSHTGRVKWDGRADAMPPGAILSPAEPFQLLSQCRGCQRQCFISLYLPLAFLSSPTSGSLSSPATRCSDPICKPPGGHGHHQSPPGDSIISSPQQENGKEKPAGALSGARPPLPGELRCQQLLPTPRR